MTREVTTVSESSAHGNIRFLRLDFESSTMSKLGYRCSMDQIKRTRNSSSFSRNLQPKSVVTLHSSRAGIFWLVGDHCL